MPEPVKRDVLVESVQVTHAVHATGQYLHVSPLMPSADGARVRVRDGKVSVTNRPFVETHEHIGGYFLIEAGSLAKANDSPLAFPARVWVTSRCTGRTTSKACPIVKTFFENKRL